MRDTNYKIRGWMGSNKVSVRELAERMGVSYNTLKTRMSGKTPWKLSDIEKKLITSEKDTLRTQLLIMLSDYPEETQEIMTIAQHYFGDLKGDWYATSLFNRWITEREVAEPAWFDKNR